mgnify:CR=1 FL=1
MKVFKISCQLVLVLLCICFSCLDAGRFTPSVSSSKGGQKNLTKKRILHEYREIRAQGLTFSHPFNESNDEVGVRLVPTKNILEWHFSFTGMDDSAYAGGIYHGRIILPKEYPRRAPQICLLTPNGRWEVRLFTSLSFSRPLQ